MEYTRFSLNIPEDTITKVKRMADRRGMSATSLINAVLHDFVNSPREGQTLTR